MARRKRRKRGYSGPAFRLPQLEISAEIKKDVIAIFLLVFALLSFLSFFDLAGGLGGKISEIIKLLFGWGFILFPFALISWGWKMIKSESIFDSKSSLFGIIILTLSLLSLLHLFYEPFLMFSLAKSGSGGGFLGAGLAWILISLIGKWGSLVIIFAMITISVLLIFDISFVNLLSKFKFSKINNGISLIKKKKESETPADQNDDEEELSEDEGEYEEEVVVDVLPKEKKGIISSLKDKLSLKNRVPEFSIKPLADDETYLEETNKYEEPEENQDNNIDKDFRESAGVGGDKNKNWLLPGINLLEGGDSKSTSGDIKANLNIIKVTLANFGIEVEMGEVKVGPTVTQYKLKPAVGIKLSRITSLQNDLALALAAHSLRLEAPIPGKSWVGLELPNKSVGMVRLKSMLLSSELKDNKAKLNVILGRDVSGSAIFANLEKMPHLMIAGSTGSGKTVCINTLITGLLFQNSPEKLKFIMIDPKRVELTPYDEIPHLLTPVITDPEKAVNSLKWAIGEMEKRYETLSHLGCRNIESYNTAVETKYTQREILPYIIIVIDELADLMATHGREVEATIVRLAQMARAVGIHLVLSTQRPSVEVITGLIKANVTTRIAFQVASQIDSRTILDMSGAEKLLGSGDMLYLSGDSNKPRRIQGVFISENEVRKVVEFLKNQKEEENEYIEEIVKNNKTNSESDFDQDDEEDRRFNEAVEFVRDAGKASASLLQRRMRVGYSRAARLLDLMENKGIIGPGSGSKPREVYADMESGEEIKTEEGELEE
ncbi:DNA translocase FtsK [Patescibacteria group bacterium]|nr:DNA translocase FtsK [Patescibacteria group bacterium]